MLSFPSMTRHERQIPRGGKAEGAHALPKGACFAGSSRSSSTLWHNCEKAASFRGGLNSLFSAACASCKFASFVLFSDAHSASVRIGNAASGGARRPAEPLARQPHHPSVRIGGRVPGRLLFSHARLPSCAGCGQRANNWRGGHVKDLGTFGYNF